MQRARRKAGLPPDRVLYLLRHRFSVLGIKRKVHMKVLAELLGHRSVAMLDRVYANIAGDLALLDEGLQQMFAPAKKGGAA